MLFFLLFIVLMPALTYADYRLYGKKMEETLAAQPDYDQNRENYEALLAKLMARQKRKPIPSSAPCCALWPSSWASIPPPPAALCNG